MSNTYDKGRLNLPFVGICTFGKYPYTQDWDKIEADFSYAANNLPSFRGGVYDEPGRPVSTTAKAYLGKTLLYQGKWNSALNKLEEVINSGLYALQSDYFANFRSDGENGPEMIFSIQFSEPQKTM